MVIRDRANQQQDVNALSRDTDNANGSIGAIFDKEKEQNRLKQAQLIGEIAGQTMDIVRTQGDINGLQKAKDKHPGLDATALRKTPEYQAEMQKYGTGSDMQRAAQAVTGALQVLAVVYWQRPLLKSLRQRKQQYKPVRVMLYCA
ncbi:hypothetical protein [Serratia liquefaciens]|uniref:hypothetical protein n=1 Tax=Serratia liquefaciens TaxID=614 RepID=UPI002B05C927|nr:hypothetical protein [Serratia liquefaciens]